MPDLPKKKVGIIACSGEELPEGTVTRLAALKVLEQLRPGDTVTICLPLFLAGGEGDRAFARFYPTVAIDGCAQRCAARATEKYSAKPAASFVVADLVAECRLGKPEGSRRLNEAGRQAVDVTAERVAEQVDVLLERRWNRRAGAFAEEPTPSAEAEAAEPVMATCACGSGIPVQTVVVNGQTVTLVGLPLILAQFRDSGKTASDDTTRELLEIVKIYNPVPPGEAEAYASALAREYTAFCRQKARQS
jgi:uncharacterized metal-binding protein